MMKSIYDDTLGSAGEAKCADTQCPIFFYLMGYSQTNGIRTPLCHVYIPY